MTGRAVYQIRVALLQLLLLRGLDVWSPGRRVQLQIRASPRLHALGERVDLVVDGWVQHVPGRQVNVGRAGRVEAVRLGPKVRCDGVLINQSKKWINMKAENR